MTLLQCFSDIISASREAAILLDSKGKILAVNKAALSLLKLKKSSSLDKVFAGSQQALAIFHKSIPGDGGEGELTHKNGEVYKYTIVRISNCMETAGAIFLRPVKKESEEKLPEYYSSLLSSISPIVTIDSRQKIRYANGSFLSEFKSQNRNVKGEHITDVIPLKKKDMEEFVRNIKDVTRTVQNAEFSAGKRIFGYSLFHFENETGIILKDITSLKKLQREVESLHARMLRLQEKERQNIAAELHDSVGQTILAAKLNFTTFMMQPGEMGDRYNAGLELIDRASEELREIYQNLYPSILSDLGLAAAIKWYAKNYLEVKGIHTDLQIDMVVRLPQEIEVGLFRMVQELFNNIVKHSGAKNTTLELKKFKGDIRLKVSDDGHGFTPGKIPRKKGGLGLPNLRSRVNDLGGKIKIESEEKKGTETLITIPVRK